ncbi:MAG: FAD-dependent oxidoreductase [Leptospiraceae bacterium]|nr:FAD-dependent oxidoreductase [Leptospiraceae bacterium]
MKKNKTIKKIGIVTFILLVVASYYYFDLGKFITFENLKMQQKTLTEFTKDNLLYSSLIYLSIYIISVAFSFPGASILTLAGGTIFGLWLGTLLVSFASTIGASLNFLFSRFLLKDYLEKKFPAKIKEINKGIQEDGAFYLFTLRMVPIFPFFLINLLMGLTSFPLWKYFYISQIGMLAGTIVYVNAGTQLANINSIKSIFSLEILISLSLLGVLPIFTKSLVDYIKSQKYLRRYKKPKKFDYNLISIGAGSAGLVTAYIAAAVKSKVALIEKHKMGGDCLNYGCVPSKALISTAKKVKLTKTALEFGLDSASIKFDFSKIMNRVSSVIQKIEPHDSIERYTKLGVECFSGNAKILSPYEVEINGKILTTKNIVLATGAEPLVPPIPGLEKINYLTSENLWDIRNLPKRLVILGGGPIGCELAQAFSRLGSEVTIIEMAPSLLVREDEIVFNLMTKVFESEKIKILTKHKAESVHLDGNKKFIRCKKDDQSVDVEFDEVLVALGRRARTKGFGLEEMEIQINQNGTIQVDEYLRTNYPNIYACGDVVGPYQFTHVAAHQAWYASVNALFSPFKKFKVDYRVIPWTTFTDPEVARVGLSEKDAIAAGLDFEVSHFEMEELDRAIADGETKGFIRVITPKGKDKILGVTIVSANAGELLAEYVLAMKHNLGLNKILGTIHSYPTMSEANKYVAGVWKKANAPQKLLEYVQKFHTWRRN